MDYTLDALALFICRQKEEFRAKVKKEAEKLTLTQIVKEINQELNKKEALLNIADKNYDFEEGKSIKIYIVPFDITIDPSNLTMHGADMALKVFSGSAVKHFYRTLAPKVSKEVKDYLENLPF